MWKTQCHAKSFPQLKTPGKTDKRIHQLSTGVPKGCLKLLSTKTGLPLSIVPRETSTFCPNALYLIIEECYNE